MIEIPLHVRNTYTLFNVLCDRAIDSRIDKKGQSALARKVNDACRLIGWKDEPISGAVTSRWMAKRNTGKDDRSGMSPDTHKAIAIYLKVSEQTLHRALALPEAEFLKWLQNEPQKEIAVQSYGIDELHTLKARLQELIAIALDDAIAQLSGVSVVPEPTPPKHPIIEYLDAIAVAFGSDFFDAVGITAEELEEIRANPDEIGDRQISLIVNGAWLRNGRQDFMGYDIEDIQLMRRIDLHNQEEEQDEMPNPSHTENGLLT